MLTQARLQELLRYDPETGEFFRRVRTSNRSSLTKPAGWRGVNGYRYITVDSAQHLAHRLAWLYVYGQFPAMGLDHINRDPLDNRIANLREADKSQNAINSKARSSLSGLKGVHWHKHSNRWCATIWLKGHYKYLGLFDTAEEAHAAFCSAAKEHHGEFFCQV